MSTSARAKKRADKKARKRENREKEQNISERLSTDNKQQHDAESVVYVPDIPVNDYLYEEFKAVFDKFVEKEQEEVVKEDEEMQQEEDEDHQQEEQEEDKRLSNKQKKKLQRMKVAQLKQLVFRPDLVDLHDPNSHEPELLIHLKTIRNAIPVPLHWSQKRKYLQGKRGYVKPPFKLPKFIEDTGIGQLRASQLAADEEKKAKQKQREKVLPKMGRLNLDYQVLHDAFFKHQTKPKATRYGELYYEGKEFEVKLLNKRPGILSDQLRSALGMKELSPPPWLVNMQRFGPPPSYPNMKIPGLNAPLPPGAMYGYDEGKWGKPPVDQYGNPIYGDPFGVYVADDVDSKPAQNIEKGLWGDPEDIEYTEMEQPQYLTTAEDEEEEEYPYEDMDMEQPTVVDFESGISSVPSGMETPDAVQLRKLTGLETPDVSQPSSAYNSSGYKVLEVKQTGVGSSLFGSSHTYKIQDDADQSTPIVQEEDVSENIAEEVRKRKLKEEVAAKKKMKVKF
jgi:splicing factor 3B subunit 2